jgi:hypothetical protein
MMTLSINVPNTTEQVLGASTNLLSRSFDPQLQSPQNYCKKKNEKPICILATLHGNHPHQIVTFSYKVLAK